MGGAEGYGVEGVVETMTVLPSMGSFRCPKVATLSCETQDLSPGPFISQSTKYLRLLPHRRESRMAFTW